MGNDGFEKLIEFEPESKSMSETDAKKKHAIAEAKYKDKQRKSTVKRVVKRGIEGGAGIGGSFVVGPIGGAISRQAVHVITDAPAFVKSIKHKEHLGNLLKSTQCRCSCDAVGSSCDDILKFAIKVKSKNR